MKNALTYPPVGIYALAIAVLSVIALTMAAGNGPAPAADLGIMLQAGANGLCADNAGSAKPGTAVQGWKCSARNLNQRFQRVSRGKNLWALRNKLSGLCIDAGNGKKKSGINVIQVPCAKRSSQTLKVVSLPRPADKKRFQLRAAHSGLCLQLAGNAKHGGRLTQAKCDTRNPDQKFHFRN